ncbi:MAG TPA: cytochrome P450 [Burkholderiaceae bacterium]|nr:cytochrome P450 [Burkholderiaceae bacterium]
MPTSVQPPDAAAAPSGCPVRAGAPRFPQPRENPMDPPRVYAEWPPISRVTQWNGAPAWFVTRPEDIRALLMDARLSADATNPAYPAQTEALARLRRDYQAFAQMDPPAHTAERKLFAEEFNVRGVERMRPRVQAIVDALVDRIEARGGEADLIADFAMPLPCSVIGTLLGVPESDHASLVEWARLISSRTASADEVAALVREFCDGYLSELVERKAREPGDDLLSRLVVEHMLPGALTKRKVVSLARLFLTAGHESTTGTLGLGLAALLHHPDQMRLLVEDPSRIRGAVEEILRYTDVTHSGRLRVVAQDLEIGGVTMRAGDAVIMHQPTANRDPGLYPDPHRFDITRPLRPHLAFGTGIHACIGQPLARLELQLGIGTLVRRLPGLRPVLPTAELPFQSTQAIYGLEALPVRW